MLKLLKTKIWKLTRFTRDADSFLWADLLASGQKVQVNASNLDWVSWLLVTVVP